MSRRGISGEGGSRRSLGTVGDETAEQGSRVGSEAVPSRHVSRGIDDGERQRRPQCAGRAVLAVVGCRRTRRLFGLVASSHHLVGHRPLLHRFGMRHATQHGGRRQRLQRQGQHQHKQQESVEGSAHVGSVIKKVKPPKRPGLAAQVPAAAYRNHGRRLRGS
jgi:hypothetical protein